MALNDAELEGALREAFLWGLDLPPDTDVTTLALEQHPLWDSLGHMTLVTAIEERFGVTLDGDEVTALDCYPAALAILRARGLPRRDAQDEDAARGRPDTTHHRNSEESPT